MPDEESTVDEHFEAYKLVLQARKIMEYWASRNTIGLTERERYKLDTSYSKAMEHYIRAEMVFRSMPEDGSIHDSAC